MAPSLCREKEEKVRKENLPILASDVLLCCLARKMFPLGSIRSRNSSEYPLQRNLFPTSSSSFEMARRRRKKTTKSQYGNQMSYSHGHRVPGHWKVQASRVGIYLGWKLFPGSWNYNAWYKRPQARRSVFWKWKYLRQCQRSVWPATGLASTGRCTLTLRLSIANTIYLRTSSNYVSDIRLCTSNSLTDTCTCNIVT